MAGALNLIAALLQLTVPSYAFRLVRRFGSQRVGWFIVIAFFSLALLHLMETPGPASAPATGVVSDIVYAVGSILLLFGMAHVESVCAERDQKLRLESSLREEWTLQNRDETAQLIRKNQELLEEIARHEQIEKNLEAAVARYRLLFTENPQPMWVLDLRSCRFLEVNQAALRQHGFTADEFKARTGRDLVVPRAAAEFLQDVSRPCTGVESRGIWQHFRKDGTLMDVEITALDLPFGDVPARLIMADDVTQRRQSEEELRKTNKLEALGRVAAGVAQHFSHIHALVHSHAAALIEDPQNPRAAEQLDQISGAMTRAIGVTRQLLAAGARQFVRLEAVDLNGLIRNADPMLRRLVGRKISLQHTQTANLPCILADHALIEQIIVNLVLNARDAMPDGGKLSLSTATVRTGLSDGELSGDAGSFVRLSVADTGCGMTPQVKAQIFEPFFTTQDSGDSLGLGLASVYGIVRQHCGWVEFTSEIGVGTEFRVFLPSAPTPIQPALTGGESAPRPAKGTVLLVEAEDRTRAMARCALIWSGYRVIEADSSSLALLLWDSLGTNVDLVLTNVAFEGSVSGGELVDRLRATRPGVKVIYLANNLAQAAALPPGSRRISKPCAPDRLLEEVRDALGQNA